MRVFLLTIALLANLPTSANAEQLSMQQWRDANDRFWLQGTLTVKAAPWALYQLLLDNAQAPHWVERMRYSRILAQREQHWFRVLSVFDSPWPVTDRYLVSDANFSVNRDCQLTIDVSKTTTHDALDKLTEQERSEFIDDAISLRFFQAQWQVSVIDAEQVLLRYRVSSDPGGLLPDWLARSTLNSSVRQTLLNLQQQLRKTDYQQRPDNALFADCELGL
ncbi:hypothetical protein [Idiomarina xiamenensis]|uniref:START domain-containing protein n=1 Tax=Idiomarina xiamenensis 10-D-4 TaxID=740709 RepID=K2KFV1_9GAMM|nr:hypothetical protein [Idiomarina xiamenensis]EKE86888.1 hypothetical protein A10D4_01562 [Idiomarina xiamenensis 10-D-4]